MLQSHRLQASPHSVCQPSVQLHRCAQAEIERRTLNISGCHAFGGRLHFTPTPDGNGRTVVRRQPLTLRIFMDHSLVEAFTSTGEALTARVYRERTPATEGQQESNPASPPSIQVVSVGTETVVSHLHVHRVESIWQSQEALEALEARLRAEQEQLQGQPHEQEQLVMASVATMSSITTASSAEAMAWEQHECEKESQLREMEEDEVLASLLEGAARLASPGATSAVVSGGIGLATPALSGSAALAFGSHSGSSKRSRPTYAERRSSSASPPSIAATASASTSSPAAGAAGPSSAPVTPSAYLASSSVAPLPASLPGMTSAMNPIPSPSSALGQPPVVPPCTTDAPMCNAGSVLGGSSSGSGTTASTATPPASPSMFDLGAGLSSALLQLALTSPRRPCGPAIAPPASPMQGAAGPAPGGGDWA
jgi:hypothetical protein